MPNAINLSLKFSVWMIVRLSQKKKVQCRSIFSRPTGICIGYVATIKASVDHD
jgi:hypothetical protein